MYRKIGGINGFSEIPWDKEIIITGTVGNGWYWNSKGTFVRDKNGFRFRDECGVYTQFSTGDFISLSVMEKVNTAFLTREEAEEAVRHEPNN